MKLILVCGHYGCGKTNFSLNLASGLSRCGEKRTVLVDMDIVNPYFRSGDYEDILKKHSVELIAPVFSSTTVDAPCISPRVASVFDTVGTDREYDYAVFDIGGDDAGAVALAQYSERIKQAGYEMYYVINRYREQVATPDGALEILREIEAASHLSATAIVNNSHLCNETEPEDVIRSFEYADKVSALCGLPVKHTVVTEKISKAAGISGRSDIFCAERLVLPDWEKAGAEEL